MGHMEIQGQMDYPPKSSWLPPTPLHQEGHSRGLLGIQDQRMVANRGHPGQKPKKDIRILGKNKTKVPPGAQDAIITTLQAPTHNFGKDECVVDMMGHETHYWQGTESGLLGAFEFKGACTAGDGSCDTGSKSMGEDFFNLGQLGWNTQTPLPPSSLHDQHTRNSRKVGREDEGVSSTQPEW
jgi:hypothetical protein